MLSALTTNEPQTGIELARQLKVTRGGVTRAAKKLVAADLIVGEKQPTNQKNIYYRLTPAGAAIARVHDQMHVALKAFLIGQMKAKYSPADFALVEAFLTDLMAAEEQFGRRK